MAEMVNARGRRPRDVLETAPERTRMLAHCGILLVCSLALSFVQACDSGGAGLVHHPGTGAAWGQTCSWCAQPQPKESGKLLRCSWCRAAFYCGKPCQVKHWPAHRMTCPPAEAGAQPQGPAAASQIVAAEDATDQASVRTRRRVAQAEDVRNQAAADRGKLPTDWKICRACRLPVILEWLQCPSCDRPISELEDTGNGLMPEQSELVQSTRILGDVQRDLLEGAETNNIAQMQIAEAAGANISATDPDLYDSGALHYAAGQGHLEAVKWLVQRGAAVDEVNSCSESPLHWAAENGHSAVVEYLLAQGADMHRLNSWREGAIDLAASAGYLCLVKVLRTRGAREQPIRFVGKPSSALGGTLGHEGEGDPHEDGSPTFEAEAEQDSKEVSEKPQLEDFDFSRQGGSDSSRRQQSDGTWARTMKPLSDAGMPLSVEGPEAPGPALSDEEDDEAAMTEDAPDQEERDSWVAGRPDGVAPLEGLSDGKDRLSTWSRDEMRDGDSETTPRYPEGRRATAAPGRASAVTSSETEAQVRGEGGLEEARMGQNTASREQQQSWGVGGSVGHENLSAGAGAQEGGLREDGEAAKHERIAPDGSTYFAEEGSLSAGDMAQDIGVVQKLLSQLQACKFEDNPDAAAAMINADRKQAIEQQRQRVSEHMRHAADEFERALEERARRIEQGESEQDVPPAMPRVPDTPLRTHGSPDEISSLDSRLRRETLRHRQPEQAGEPRGGAHEDLGGEKFEGPGGMRPTYESQMERELERVGGIQNVPPLSSLIQQLESQDGNTL